MAAPVPRSLTHFFLFSSVSSRRPHHGLPRVFSGLSPSESLERLSDVSCVRWFARARFPCARLREREREGEDEPCLTFLFDNETTKRDESFALHLKTKKKRLFLKIKTKKTDRRHDVFARGKDPRSRRGWCLSSLLSFVRSESEREAAERRMTFFNRSHLPLFLQRKQPTNRRPSSSPAAASMGARHVSCQSPWAVCEALATCSSPRRRSLSAPPQRPNRRRRQRRQRRRRR